MPTPFRRLLAALVVACLLTGCSVLEETPLGGGGSSAPEPEPPGPADKLGLATGWGPTEHELDRAVRQVRALTVPELAGQVIVADWTGTTAPVRMVEELHLGGLIAFSENVTSGEQISRVHRTLRRRVDRDWPLWLSVDQEGGLVERVTRGTTRYPAFMSAGAARDPGLTRRAYAAAAGELHELGFTANFAPVADVTSGPSDPTIGSRAAGSGPARVARQVVAAAEGHRAGGVVPVLKHFPGHGSVPGDSHLTLPVQSHRLGWLRSHDLRPFRAAVKAGLPSIMVGHINVRAVSPGRPSSLSRKVVTGLLRRDLGFDGLVVTDSLEMAAVTRSHSVRQAAVRALWAGNDVVLMPPDPAAARAGIVAAVRSGKLSRQRLLQSAARQVGLLIHQRSLRRHNEGSAASAPRRSHLLSAAAITSVAGPCRGRLVEQAVHPVGDPEAVAAFSSAAQRAGLRTVARRTPPADLAQEVPPPRRGPREGARRFRQRRAAWAAAERRRDAALADWQAGESARLAAATSIGFSGYGDGPYAADVAVATDRPWVLGGSDAPVRIATYGDTPGAMHALVDVLLGREPAPGQLPVRVAGVPRQGC